MDLTKIRCLLGEGKLRIRYTSHARIESLKDGLTIDNDLEYTLMHGEVIEEYPDRDRMLLLGFASDTGFPIHIIAEYYEGDDVVTVVSAYVPEDDQWDKNYKTRKRSKKS